MSIKSYPTKHSIHKVESNTSILILKRLGKAYHDFQKSNDVLNANKLLDLMEKVEQQEFTICFCGHFSAGKSSIINYLFAEGILPTSPIPTSANIVKITVGDPKAKVTFFNGKQSVFLPPIDMEQIKEYCLDGEKVKIVEVFHPSHTLAKNVSIMDTPGIDSTDPLHAMATESILHVSDAVFYVMDYNHVQSEMNIAFTKMLVERGLPVYLIVNQIDKHNESELALQAFKNNVTKVFNDWGISPVKIFFTSLNAAYDGANDLSLFIQQIYDLADENVEHMYANVIRASKVIIAEHMSLRRTELEAQLTSEIEAISKLSYAEIVKAKDELASIDEKSTYLANAPNQFAEQAQTELKKILYNVSLMPYETRQLASSYLESMKKGFRIGFFSTANKVEVERSRRLELLYADVNKKASAQIEWHVRAMLLQLLNQYGCNNDATKQQVHNWEVKLTPAILQQAIKKDAQLNGDYLLNYSKEVSEAIKLAYRKSVLDLLDAIQENIIHQFNLQMKDVEARYIYVQTIINAAVQIESMERTLTEEGDYWQQLINGALDEQLSRDVYNIGSIRRNMKPDTSSEIATDAHNEDGTITNTATKASHSTYSTAKSNKNETILPQMKEQLHLVANHLRTAANELQGIVGFEIDSKEMLEKAKRLEENRFTVALFGAFSAGKTSFANALIGENLLPTSPHPTTATVTKIMAPTSTFPHGTIRIKIKSEVDLLADMQYYLRFFNRSAFDLSNAIEEASQISGVEVTSKTKPYFFFLHTVKQGIVRMEGLLGSVLEHTIVQLDSYISDEEIAIFIDWVEVYYSIPITEQGLVLVDTPGADSIHSRHTSVAFEYIKNVDAVIYVTYYNHAFSQAVQLFLAQLGRVKDVLEIDKMFFIVNAIDLAQSQDDILLVKQHVGKNLHLNGILQPRIYAVSSKSVLEAKALTCQQLKRGGDKDKLHTSDFLQFERDFMEFIYSDIVNVVISSVSNDIRKASEKLKEYSTLALESENSRIIRLEKIELLQQKVISTTGGFPVESYVRSIEQEIKELVYYIYPRIVLRLREAFKVTFSPATIRQDTPNIKLALKSALQEWFARLNAEIEQELLVTSLRIEKFVNNMMVRFETELTETILQINNKMVFHPYKKKSEYSMPKIEWHQISENAFLSHLSMFKTHKHFFEENGNHQLLDTILAATEAPIAAIMEEQARNFHQHYTELFQQVRNNWLDYFNLQIEQYFAGERAALSTGMNVTIYQNKYEILRGYAEQH